MLKTLDQVDHVRRTVTAGISRKRKSELGQFMTPSSVARFMASLFTNPTAVECRLLDAGAGLGSLTSAFLDKWASAFPSIEAHAFEIDEGLRSHLSETLEGYAGRLPLQPHVYPGDFIDHAVEWIQSGDGPRFTHSILNPPYKKINTGSNHRLQLRRAGLETVNMYSAFVAMAVALMETGGQVVAIIPRSFCNGPYYRPFRDFILDRAALRHMHLFESRKDAFKDDDVLQENIILALERGGEQGEVTVSTSSDDTFTDYSTHSHAFNRIVFPDDLERFIHVPTTVDKHVFETSKNVRWSLKDIGVSVSTGPVVDFRLRDHLRDMPEAGSVPLLYPGHFSSRGVDWPKIGLRKPNAIMLNDETARWLYPNGFYAVVRRFSSKEERRRIVASIIRPTDFGGHELLGLENHLNVFHEGKRGLSEELALGLFVFLNCTAVDDAFRRFNGHTQVNATDLKTMKYPSRADLIRLGQWAKLQNEMSQEKIDRAVAELDA